jgi:hypothetical protein
MSKVKEDKITHYSIIPTIPTFQLCLPAIALAQASFRIPGSVIRNSEAGRSEAN